MELNYCRVKTDDIENIARLWELVLTSTVFKCDTEKLVGENGMLSDGTYKLHVIKDNELNPREHLSSRGYVSFSSISSEIGVVVTLVYSKLLKNRGNYEGTIYEYVDKLPSGVYGCTLYVKKAGVV